MPDDVILSRISDRWVHLPSGRVYNLSYNPPKVAGHDDDTGEPLIKRPDDNPVRLLPFVASNIVILIECEQEVFSRRLEKFYEATSPLLAYYTSAVTLAGSTSDEIWPQLERVVRGGFPAIRERAEHKRRTSLSDAVLSRDVDKPRAKASLRDF